MGLAGCHSARDCRSYDSHILERYNILIYNSLRDFEGHLKVFFYKIDHQKTYNESLILSIETSSYL